MKKYPIVNPEDTVRIGKVCYVFDQSSSEAFNNSMKFLKLLDRRTKIRRSRKEVRERIFAATVNMQKRRITTQSPVEFNDISLIKLFRAVRVA